jgi:triosephosphate isomerase (TIM)
VSARRPLIAANWKMNLLTADAVSYCEALRAGLGERSWSADAGPEAVLFPSAPLVPLVARELEGAPVGVGGQDLHPEDSGAHTGDVSGLQWRDAGATWALCGHSERRQAQQEGDDLVGRKLAAALRHDLRPVLCVGESAAERRNGRALPVLARQVKRGLAPAAEAGASLETVTVAYEPVWAIGTGDTATPDVVQGAHAFLRGELRQALGDQAEGIRLLYGGSVKPDNAAELIALEDVDGFLVGGAALDVGKFLSIMERSEDGSDR